MDEISSGEKTFCSALYSTWIIGLSPAPAMTLNGQWLMSCWTAGSSNLRPMSRLASKTVLCGFSAVWFLAASPTRRSVSVNATYDGEVLLPCSLGMISTRSPDHTATQL